MDCTTCGHPLDPAAAHNPNGPDWDHHPTCRPTTHCPCTTPFDQPHTLAITTKKPKETKAHPLPVKPGQHPPEAARHTLQLLDLPQPPTWDHRWSGNVLYTAETDSYHMNINRPPAVNGHHCPDCHANFANAGIAELHRRTIRHPCRQPATVLNIITGRPLLQRDPAGVWQLDRTSLWPSGTRPPSMFPGLPRPPSWKFGTGANRGR